MAITHPPLTVGSSHKPFRIHVTYGDNGELSTARARLTAYTAAAELKAPVYIILSESTWEPTPTARLTVTDQNPSETPGTIIETATAEGNTLAFRAATQNKIVELIKAAAERNKARRKTTTAPTETGTNTNA